MMRLATTALEWSWGETGPILFLGEWCRRYERTAVWERREHLVVHNHWDDRPKLQRDYAYLHELHDELLGCLARALGELHRLERSQRFWQTLLDPWLARYLGVAFDRWECLRSAFEQYEISETLLRAVPSMQAPRDHLHFVEICDEDEWNHDFFSDILRYEFADKCTLRPYAEALQAVGAAPPPRPPQRSWKGRFKRRIDRLLGRLTHDDHFAFVQSYFPRSALVRLSLNLGQLPRLEFSEFGQDPLQHVGFSLDPIRHSLALHRSAANRFESFLHQRIGKDLLQAHVESFALIRGGALSLKLHPKYVFTANAHWFNDLFKHWIAEQVDRCKTRFVVMDHGGALPPRFGTMGFEEDIADVKVTWSLPYHEKHVRLPPSKLVGRVRQRSDGDRLVVIGSEMPRYAFSVASIPIAEQALASVELTCRLHDALDSGPRGAFLVKPYPNLGLRTRDRFVSRLGKQKVSAEPSLTTVLRSARMVVCTYPQTTFSEAICCGAPTLLVYPPHLWETVERFRGLIDALRTARIVFFDPKEASTHINSVWGDPLDWWDSRACQGARRRFHEEALDLREDWLVPWLEFTRRLRSAPAPQVCAMLQP
jgi:putative transferase (TIGR04331 family)